MGALALGCARPAPSPVPAPPALRSAFRGVFLVGAALNAAQFSGQDTLGAAIVKAQFNSITPENALKWASVHPRPGTYDFAAGDRYVEFGERNSMFVVGHNLVWHNQTPRWVFQDSGGTPVSRDTLLARLRDHIHTVVGRYRGRIKGWDVVNEALEDDGTLRRTPWLTILGEDYLATAFRFAHGLPDSLQQALARRYAELFGSYLRHRGTVTRVTFWGVTDRDSWLNNWPVRGRTNYPLLFDRDGRPKPAFAAVIGTAPAKQGRHD